MRGGRYIRRTYAVLIAAAMTIVLFHEFTTRFGAGHGGPRLAGLVLHGEDVVWALPALALGAAVGAGLVVASGSRVGHSVLERLHLPGLGRDSRARSIGLVWGVDLTGVGGRLEETLDIVGSVLPLLGLAWQRAGAVPAKATVAYINPAGDVVAGPASSRPTGSPLAD